MKNSLSEKLLVQIKELIKKIGPKQAVKYELPQLEKIVMRLGQLSDDCETCNQYLKDIGNRIDQFDSIIGDKSMAKEYRKMVKSITDHLLKKHRLVTEGYYLTLYLSLGLSLGVVFGIIYDNLGTGIALGMAIGTAIGVGLDASYKKKGRVI